MYISIWTDCDIVGREDIATYRTHLYLYCKSVPIKVNILAVMKLWTEKLEPTWVMLAGWFTWN